MFKAASRCIDHNIRDVLSVSSNGYNLTFNADTAGSTRLSLGSPKQAHLPDYVVWARDLR